MAKKSIRAIGNKVHAMNKYFGVTNQVIVQKSAATNSKSCNVIVIPRALHKRKIKELISKLQLTTCGGLKNEADTIKQYLQLLQLTIIPGAGYRFNKNIIRTDDAAVSSMNKKIDEDDEDVVVNLNSSSTSEDTSNLLDMLLNTHEMLALKRFLKHKGLHVLCDIMDYVIMGERRGDDELLYQQDIFYLLKPFIGNNQFGHGQKPEVMDEKHNGVVGSADLHLDEQPSMEDQQIQYNSVSSNNYWVCGSTSRRVLMLLKLLDILLHLETHGVLTSTRVMQNSPRHPRYCMYKLSVLLANLQTHEDGRLRSTAREVRKILKLSYLQ